MRIIFRSILWVLAVLFLSLIFPTNVGAIGNPVKISTSTSQTIFPQTVADSNGYLHLVWMEVATTTESWGGQQNPGILYSRWNGDTWSSPLKISQNTGFAEIPSISADSANTIHTVWDDDTYGVGGRVVYKSRSAAGTWSAIETLPLPTEGNLSWSARVAADNTNAPNVVFSSHISNTCCDDAIYWTKKVSGSWSAPVKVSLNASGADINDSQWADLRGDSAGNLHLIYWSFGQGTFYRKYSGGSWSTPILITNRGDYHRLAITPAGEVFVTWHNSDNNGVEVRWTVGGAWQSPTVLTTSSEYSFWGFPIMGVTTDSKQRAHVGWGEKDAGNLIDLKYRSFESGTWQAARDVDLDNNDADSPVVYPDKWDNQHFAWTETNPSTSQWEIYYRVAEGTIQTVGTGGGTITANPNNTTYATLSIPSLALSASTEIGIQIGPVPESVNPAQVTIPRAFTFRPNGLVFNSASTATVYYTDPEIGTADERQLKPWIWNSQTSAWEARTGSVNRAQNRIAVSLSGFSLYGISAPIVKTTWLKPTENEVVKQGAYHFEFQIAYADGSQILAPATPDELVVKLKDENGNMKSTLQNAPSGITYDTTRNIYKGTLNLQRGGLVNGNYSLGVYLADNLVGLTNFTLNR